MVQVRIERSYRDPEEVFVGYNLGNKWFPQDSQRWRALCLLFESKMEINLNDLVDYAYPYTEIDRQPSIDHPSRCLFDAPRELVKTAVLITHMEDIEEYELDDIMVLLIAEAIKS